MNTSKLWLAASKRPAITITTTTTKRFLGSGGGSRGARGHGWWINYRAGKGGRHLQGEYSHLDLEARKAWNDAVFSLGSQQVFMDILVEPFRHAQGTPQESSRTGNDGSTGSSNTEECHRLVIELASEVLPKAVQNFLGLLKADTHGYKSTTLHRLERSVGLMGGNVWNDTGKCLEEFRMSSSAQSMNQTEQMVLSHVPGVISMLCQRVDEIDSRFIFCSQHAPHLDGRALAIGRVDADSLQKLQEWESSLVTRNGRPTTVNLRIVECGVLEENENEEQVAS